MKKHKGFTLVELIVVLVILAILAAVLVPALLGYIEKAKSNKLSAAQDLRQAAQGKLNEVYAKDMSFSPGSTGGAKYDQFTFAKEFVAYTNVNFNDIAYIAVGFKSDMRSDKHTSYSSVEDQHNAYSLVLFEVQFKGDDTIYEYFNGKWYTDRMITLSAAELEKETGVHLYSCIRGAGYDSRRNNMPAKYKIADNITKNNISQYYSK